MRLMTKFMAIGMSALFAATPVVPASAMPLSATAIAPVTSTATNGDIQLVQDRRIWRRGMTTERRDGRGWRDDRRGDRDFSDRRWRRDNEYRAGYYRGHRGYRYQRPGYRYHDGLWFPLAAFGAGALIGGVIANQPSYSGGGSTHVSWCSNRWRSYRAYDNTYQPYGGPRRQCVSPYS